MLASSTARCAATVPVSAAPVPAPTSALLRSAAGVRLTRRSMAFAKLASAARTCSSPGAMRVVR